MLRSRLVRSPFERIRGRWNAGPKGIPSGRATPTTKCLQSPERNPHPHSSTSTAAASSFSLSVAQLAGVEIFSTHRKTQRESDIPPGKMSKKRDLKREPLKCLNMQRKIMNELRAVLAQNQYSNKQNPFRGMQLCQTVSLGHRQYLFVSVSIEHATLT